MDYVYRIGTTEVPEEWITKATRLGLSNVTAGAWSAKQPAANMTWYEAAAFVNWLNTSTGHPPAYDLTYSNGWSMRLWSSAEAWQAGGQNLYRHKDAHYFLPNEDEYYKAAFHKNDGVTANYWDYATGSNIAPRRWRAAPKRGRWCTTNWKLQARRSWTPRGAEPLRNTRADRKYRGDERERL